MMNLLWLCAAAIIGLLPIVATAQTVGGAVPPYEKPAAVPLPQRDEGGSVTVPAGASRPPVFQSQADPVAEFSTSYQRAGKPRLAFYWNRQLTDTLNDWYSDSRVVLTTQTEGTISGDINLQSSGSRQTTAETQRRTASGSQRLQPSENWEWEFQDGFLSPFLKANAIVVDRAALVRLTGANTKGANENAIETVALQGMADLLVEVLVAPNSRSTVGYELRARIIEIKTGRIVAYVNSRSLRDWNPAQRIVATNRGFELPDDQDLAFGPTDANQTYRATPGGFEQTRKPPKLVVISENLAYNVMEGLMGQWRR